MRKWGWGPPGICPQTANKEKEQVYRATGLMILEHNALAVKFGSAVLQVLESPQMVAVKVEYISLQDRSVEQGPQDSLYSMLDRDPEGLARLIPRAFPDLDRRGDARQ